MPVQDKVVLDIGGCFGAYSAYALGRGAKELHSYEPLKTNFDLLEKNISHFGNGFAYNKALVPDETTTVDFYVGKNQNNLGNSSQFIKGGRMKLSVDAVNFEKELMRIEPEVIKVDCEGAEYNIITKEFPSFVKYVTIEFHLGKKKWREVDAPKLELLFKDWVCIKKPKLTGKNWNTIGKWKR